MKRGFWALAVLALASSCHRAGGPPTALVQHGQTPAATEPEKLDRAESGHPEHAAKATTAPREDELTAVQRIHGGAGPWAVAGYRMGRYALARLGLPASSFDLEIVHHSPREVQYSCIADGAAAATGASLGKLNLSLEEAKVADLRTVYRRRSTGAALVLRLTPAFRARFTNVAPERLNAAGREVLALRDAEIFEVLP